MRDLERCYAEYAEARRRALTSAACAFLAATLACGTYVELRGVGRAESTSHARNAPNVSDPATPPRHPVVPDAGPRAPADSR